MTLTVDEPVLNLKSLRCVKYHRVSLSRPGMCGTLRTAPCSANVKIRYRLGFLISVETALLPQEHFGFVLV